MELYAVTCPASCMTHTISLYVLQYCFTVSWPARASPSQTKRSRLLAFREEADATKWHEAITAAISAQALPETPSQAGTPGIPATPTAEFFQQDIGPRRHSRTVSLSAMPSPLVSAGSVNFGGPEDHLNTPRRLADSDVGHNAALGALRTPGRTSHGWGAHTVQQRNSGQGVRLSQDRNAPAPPGTLHSGMSLETEFANTDGCGFVGAAHESTDVRFPFFLLLFVLFILPAVALCCDIGCAPRANCSHWVSSAVIVDRVLFCFVAGSR